MRKTLTEPNRWDVHSAEKVDVTLGELRLRIIQQVGWCASGCIQQGSRDPLLA